MVNNRSSGEGVSGSSPCMGTFHKSFNFSINNHSKYQNTGLFSGSSPCMGTFHKSFNFSMNDHSKYQNTGLSIFKLTSMKTY